MSDADGPVEGEEEFVADDLPPTPFSFKLVVVLGGAYLLYRAVQLVMCIPSLFNGTDCPYF